MNSRMDKYDDDTPALKKRTERNAKLYQSVEMDNYDKFDINSNVSVLKNDANKIDVNQIRDILDKKYHDVPQRQPLAMDFDENKEDFDKQKEDTKEYDINSILSKAKSEQSVNYDLERLKKANNPDYNVIEEINQKYSNNEPKKNNNDEEELKDLINTITQLELKNSSKNKDADLLNLASSDETKELTDVNKTIDNSNDNTFYTGELEVKKQDYDDFKDIQKDIKSNSILIKILIFILIIVTIAVIVIVANKYLNLGLF
jgi:hypothetical protein